MPVNKEKEEALIKRIHRSMSHQIQSNNPVLWPATYPLSHEEAAGLDEYALKSIADNVCGRLRGDGHDDIGVQIIGAPDGQYPAYKFVSELVKEE